MLTRATLLSLFLVAAPALSAQEIPGWNGTPYAGTLTLSAGFPDDPRTIDVNPGGSLANPINGSGCTGYISSNPDVVVNYDAGSYPLTFSAASETDLTLVVRDPYGTYTCDDDSGEGTNPVITVDDPSSGRYAIWAGIFSETGDYVSGVVGVSEVGAQADGAQADGSSGGGSVGGGGSSGGGGIPGAYADPLYGTLTLAAGFSDDPRLLDVNAGGSDANPLGGPGCVGYLAASQPDAVVNYRAGSYPLTFSAAAEVDLSLVVLTPNGAYHCDDDSGEGLNPRIDFESPESGAYRVWVATFSDQAGVVASVFGVSEVGAEADGSVAPSQSPSTPPSSSPTPSPSSNATSLTWTSQAVAYRGQNGTRYLVVCPPGGPSGAARLWGSNPYTDDSYICIAGVHAGVITAARGGQMTIEIRPGQSTYSGTTSHGLTSRRYGSWPGSFAVIR